MFVLPHENPGSTLENMVAFATKIPQMFCPGACCEHDSDVEHEPNEHY